MAAVLALLIKRTPEGQRALNKVGEEIYHTIKVPEASIRKLFMPDSPKEILKSPAELARVKSIFARQQIERDKETLSKDCLKAVALTNDPAFQAWLKDLGISFEPFITDKAPELIDDMKNLNPLPLDLVINNSKGQVHYSSLMRLYFAEQGHQQQLQFIFQQEKLGKCTESFEGFVKRNESKFPNIQGINFNNPKLFQQVLYHKFDDAKPSIPEKLNALHDFSVELGKACLEFKNKQRLF